MSSIPPLRRVSLKTGREMKPIQYRWFACPCGMTSAKPLNTKGALKTGERCPACHGNTLEET